MTCSIIIPTYNYVYFLEKAVESVLEQSGNGVLPEIIIIDDGSSDGTDALIRSLQKKYSIHYHYQPNRGKAAATRKGIELATGDVIFNLDADDYFLPGKIANTLALFQQYPQLVHVASPAKIVYEDGRGAEMENVPQEWLNKPINGTKLLKDFFERKLLFGGGSTFAARASVLKSVNWDDAVDMYTDEWLLIETLLKGDSFLMPEPLSVWRVHGSNYSGAALADQQKSKQQRMERSSAAILALLERGDYPEWLLKLYRLKHEVRRMVWLEESGQKSVTDIFRFIGAGILGGHSIKVLKNYHAFNRLVPGWVKKVISPRRRGGRRPGWEEPYDPPPSPSREGSASR
jgi:glycosyltransferase involved in cell wall biosynthesis